MMGSRQLCRFSDLKTGCYGLSGAHSNSATGIGANKRGGGPGKWTDRPLLGADTLLMALSF